MIRNCLIALAFVFVGGAGCGGHPGQSDCEQIADKMIDIFTTPAFDGEKLPADLNAATNDWRKTLKTREKEPTRANLIETCKTQMSKDALGCVQGASDERSLAKCFGG
jgi:hypothetical protein